MKNLLLIFFAITALVSCSKDDEIKSETFTIVGRMYTNIHMVSPLNKSRVDYYFISETHTQYMSRMFRENDTFSKSERVYNYGFDSTSKFVSVSIPDSAVGSYTIYFRLESDSMRPVTITGSDTSYALSAFYLVR